MLWGLLGGLVLGFPATGFGMLGDFPQALDDAVLDSSEAQQKLTMELLADPAKANGFRKVVFDMVWAVINAR